MKKAIDLQLPPRLKSLYDHYNGAEGWIGLHEWLNLWTIEEWLKNDRYKDHPQLAGFFLIGSGPRNNTFAIEKAMGHIFETPHLSPLAADAFQFCANDYDDFILFLFDRSVDIEKRHSAG